jgi:hypothetical protein
MLYGRAMRPISNATAVVESNEARSARHRAGYSRPAPANPVLGNTGENGTGSLHCSTIELSDEKVRQELGWDEYIPRVCRIVPNRPALSWLPWPRRRSC